MFKYGISCSLELQPVRQPVIIRGEIEHVADQVKKAGYDAIELFIRDPKQYDPARLTKAAANEGLEFCAISTGMEFTRNGLCLIDDDPAKRQKAVDRLKEHIDLGAAIGSPVVVGIMRGSIPDRLLSRRTRRTVRLRKGTGREDLRRVHHALHQQLPEFRSGNGRVPAEHEERQPVPAY